MIPFKKIILFISVVLISVSMYAQKPKYKKANFKVWGKCEMCTTTIEKAAKSVDYDKLHFCCKYERATEE